MDSDSDLSDRDISFEGLHREWEEYCKIKDDNAVRAWNEYIKQIPTSGPRGITLANTDPSNIHDSALEKDYVEIKRDYDTIVRVPPVTEDDKLNVFKPIYLNHSLKGYTFFPYINDETKAILKQPLNPIVKANGSIVTPYAHFLPCLLVQTVLPQIKSTHIDMHIICRGVENTMNVTEDVDEFIDSEAFLTASQTPLVHRRMRRICIWIKTLMHVYVIVWDSISLSEDGDTEMVYHRCFSCNSASNERSLKTLKNLTGLLQERIGATVRNLGNIVDNSIVRTVSGGMMCTSFMARCTQYLSMVANVPKSLSLIRLGVSYLTEGNNIEAMVYRIFEYHLYTLVKEHTKAGNIVLFAPERVYPFYINANDVKLVVLMPSSGQVYPVNYIDNMHGFQMEPIVNRERFRGSTCVVSSRFPFC